MQDREFLGALTGVIEFGDSVVSALTDIVLSKKVSTSIENTPKDSSEYYHETGTSYLHNREVEARDMFGGDVACAEAQIPAPVISSFSLGETPDVLGGHLETKVKTLSSINDKTKVVLSTLFGSLEEYYDVVEKSQRKTESRMWKDFKVGEYWPMADGFANGADFNCTKKYETNLIHHKKSKYSFIKLSPKRDSKYHFMRINVDAIESSGVSVPAIFVVLDSFDTVDGDCFEFRVEFFSESENSDQSKWPSVLFFDSSYNSNAVPQPAVSVAFDSNEKQIGHSIKVNGVDYFYIEASDLPEKAINDFNLGLNERVFVSAAELNPKVDNHLGLEKSIELSGLKLSKYSGYGILADRVMKTYRNRDLFISAECSSGEVLNQKFSRINTLSSNDLGIKFTGIPGAAIFYGRPSSFFSPIANGNYVSPDRYCARNEGVPGNTIKQSSREKFRSYYENDYENGIVSECEIELDNGGLGDVSVRLGLFETVIGLTVRLDSTNTVKCSYITQSGTNEEYVSSTLRKFKVIVGANCELGALKARYIVKDGDTVLFDSGVRIVDSEINNSNYLMAKRILGAKFGEYHRATLSESEVFSFWSPVITVVVDDTSSSSSSEVNVRNLHHTFNLRKEEIKGKYREVIESNIFSGGDGYYPDYYSSKRGTSPTKIVRSSDFRGFLAEVDPRSINCYGVSRNQDGIYNSYRVGFTYSAYKGDVYVERRNGVSPVVESKASETIQGESPITESSVARSVESIGLADPTGTLNSGESILVTKGTHPLQVEPKVEKFSADEMEQIDSVHARYGWKVTTYYQSEG